MKKALEQVAAFNRMVGAPRGNVAAPDATVDMELRLRLIAEEFDELLTALAPDFPPMPERSVTSAVRDYLHRIDCYEQDVRIGRAKSSMAPPNLPDVADALADLAFVTIGANDVWGIPGDAVWEEVCRANMAKAGGPKDPKTGKALKPAGWKPPDIEGVLGREAVEATRWHGHRRGDQLAEPYGPFGTRWVLDEPGPDEQSWWAYLKAPDGSLGYRSLIDITIAPRRMEPLPCEPLPERAGK